MDENVTKPDNSSVADPFKFDRFMTNLRVH